MKILFRIILVKLLIIIGLNNLSSQTFYRTGADESIDTSHLPGILLAGGATDNDYAMTWMLERADGGDVVVIRAEGADGYNNYLYSSLGVNINSVTTIVIASSEEANDDLVEEALMDAEVVFIAGGNQWDYINYWKGTRVQDALEYLINTKEITIGGTSAGMAVLGEVVFTAENNTVYSSEALADPYHWRVMLDNDFLKIPFLENTVTDTHYNRPENDDLLRKGRHVVFMARMIEDWTMPAKGIAANEYTAIAVDESGIARVFGDPDFEDHGFFLQKHGCNPEIIEAETPLTWNCDGEAVLVYRIPGNNEGNNMFDLTNWQDAEGGEWEFWYVEEGELFEDEAIVGGVDMVGSDSNISLYPNPALNTLKVRIAGAANYSHIDIIGVDGQIINSKDIESTNNSEILFDVENLNPGIYFVRISGRENNTTIKWIKF